MAIKVNPGLGTVLQHGVTGTYTNISQRVNLNGPDMSVGEAETTHLDSTTKTFRPTLADPGKISGSLWYDPQDTVHKLMFGLLAAPASNQWKLIFNDANGPTSWTFTGFLVKWSPTGMEEESNLQVDFEIRLDLGLPVSTP